MILCADQEIPDMPPHNKLRKWSVSADNGITQYGDHYRADWRSCEEGTTYRFELHSSGVPVANTYLN
jgi:hypothetical protein